MLFLQKHILAPFGLLSLLLPLSPPRGLVHQPATFTLEQLTLGFPQVSSGPPVSLPRLVSFLQSIPEVILLGENLSPTQDRLVLTFTGACVLPEPQVV